MTEPMDTECNCEKCRDPCAMGQPGWFAPGEAEKAAEYLGKPFEEFFKDRLSVDFWTENGAATTLILRPASTSSTPGDYVPWVKRPGRCVFYSNELGCTIHAVKPAECRKALSHLDDGGPGYDEWRRDTLVPSWESHRETIKTLVGHDPPEAELSDFFGILGQMTGMDW